MAGIIIATDSTLTWLVGCIQRFPLNCASRLSKGPDRIVTDKTLTWQVGCMDREIAADLCGLIQTIQTGRNDPDRHHTYKTSELHTYGEIATGLCRLRSKGAGIIIMTDSSVPEKSGIERLPLNCASLSLRGQGLSIVLSWQTARWRPDKSGMERLSLNCAV